MSNKQQLIKDCQDLAEKGIFKKDFVHSLIKQEYLNKYHVYKTLGELYEYLGKKYGKSARVIMRICNK